MPTSFLQSSMAAQLRHELSSLSPFKKELCETAGVNWCSKLQAGVVKEGDAQLGVATDPVQTILRNVGDFIDGGAA
jgi:hypothetical protein